MLDKKYLAAVRKELLSYAEKRREVIKQAGDAQHKSKRAIFALQRDNVKEAEASLEQAGTLLLGLAKKYQKDKDEGLLDEGSYRASLEEYTEAVLFNSFLKYKPLGKIPQVEVDADIFVGGLCDVPGEMLRYAIKSATERKFEMVKKCFSAAEEIIGELVDMDLTGYNRQKFDQAKGALNKLEQVRYEVSLRA